MKIANLIAYILVIIGGLNWLTIGCFQWDFVSAIFGSQAAVASRIIFALVGIAAIWLIIVPIVDLALGYRTSVVNSKPKNNK